MKKKWKLFLIIACITIITLFIFNFEYNASNMQSNIVGAVVEEIPGSAQEDTYPIILLHGFNGLHSKRIGELAFREMQNKLAKDLNYDDRGLLTKQTTCAELQYAQKPIIVRATYFALEDYTIENYSKNLAVIIDRVLYCTGAKKVDIITHSMGGIVVRQYLRAKEKEESKISNRKVRKLIMLGTPNHGGLYKGAELAHYLAQQKISQLDIDFIALSKEHEFMQTLNQNEIIEGVEYYTAAGDIDGKGDGVVLKSTVPLKGSSGHFVVHCGHIAMKNPIFCSDAYVFVKIALSS